MTVTADTLSLNIIYEGILLMVPEHHNINIIVKLLRQVIRTSVDGLLTGLSVVQQFTSDFIHVIYQGPNIRLTQLY